MSCCPELNRAHEAHLPPARAGKEGRTATWDDVSAARSRSGSKVFPCSNPPQELRAYALGGHLYQPASAQRNYHCESIGLAPSGIHAPLHDVKLKKIFGAGERIQIIHVWSYWRTGF